MIQKFESNKMPDFIGDIHGHLNDLEKLFKRLGYEKKGGIYIHSERIPVFLGDYINRGPEILGVLKLVREMQMSGNAYAIMGNHEFNFLAYHYKDDQGIPFRPNTDRYLGHISGTKQPLENNGLLETYLNWMSELPLIVKSEYFNAVHAQWNEEFELVLSNSKVNKLNEEGMRKMHSNSKYNEAFSSIVKGSEFTITQEFIDKYNFDFRYDKERIVWWKRNRSNRINDWLNVDSYNDGIIIQPNDFIGINEFDVNHKPTFFGHYWLDTTDFGVLGNNLCCLDFSVASGGFIGAYRFENEDQLISENLFHS